MNTTRHLRSLTAGVAVSLLLTGGLALSAAIPATADAPAPAWIRVGHFSPNTKAVDVQIAALAGGAVTYSLKDVSYGQVSKYLPMVAGDYVVSMRPAIAAATSKPVISRSVTVGAGTATTIAAYGPNATLKTAVFTDNLAAPPGGDARIRVIQVSTRHPKVTLETTTGQLIAKNVKPGTATSYVSVPAGNWTLRASGSGADARAQVTLVNGSIDTVLVLDNASNGVTLTTIVDSATTGPKPIGGVQTGDGWLATHGEPTNLVPSRLAPDESRTDRW